MKHTFQSVKLNLLFVLVESMEMMDDGGISENNELLDTSRKQSGDRKKLYEEMLLKEIPGIHKYEI